MRATALLQHLPNPLEHDDGDEHRRHPRRYARKHPAAPHGADLHVIAAVAPQDPEVARVRGAGGPIDNACYTCSCGFVFAASVSTTVACPHCGTPQAW